MFVGSLATVIIALNFDVSIAPMLKALVDKSVKPLNIAVIPYGIM